MVFEKVVVEVVNRFIGNYVENLDASQLSVGIWGGDVKLSNLFIKESVLDDLDLPVRVVYGNLSQLTLKVPWKNLYTEPTIAVLDGLYVIAAPRTSIPYDEAKETKLNWENKQKELARIEEVKKRENEKVKEEKQDSFVDKLVMNVLKNLEVTVTNIHIRYEDCATDPSKPFCVGVTLHELSFRTTDEQWRLKIIKDAASVIYKLLKLDSISLYWNCGSETYSSKEKASIHSLMKESISSASQRFNHMYLLEPVVSTAKLTLNMKPENSGFLMPKILLDVIFEEIVIALAKNQYQILMIFVESLERLRLGERYRKYKPESPKHGNCKRWWQFAYTCVLEETVKRKRKMWSWNHIREHRQLCKNYRDYYKAKLLTHKPSAELLSKIEQCERQLDVFNISIMRNKAEMDAKKEGGRKESESGGWFSWLGWGSKPEKVVNEHNKSISDRFQEEMTPEEKKKLCDAIGYQEAAEVDYPKEFVSTKLQVQLTSLQVKLKDTDLRDPEVVNLRLDGIRADFGQRQSANAVSVRALVEKLNAVGLKDAESDLLPQLATSSGITSTAKSGVFIDTTFETNPLDGGCDTRIVVKVRPVEVKYDAQTIITLANFFKPPKEVYAIQLQSAAIAKFDSVRITTATGLMYAIDQQKFTEITVHIHPTCIIIPSKGVYKEDCHMLVLDLGDVRVNTERRPMSHLEIGGNKVLTKEEVAKQAYNKLLVRVKSVQLLMVNPGEKWLDARLASVSDLHVLRPLAVDVDILQCVINNADFAKLKVHGNLPVLSVALSDQRLCEILKLVASIPLPEGAPAEEEEESKTQGPDAKLLTIQEDDESSILETDTTRKYSERASQSAFLNATNMELNFEISEICLALSQRSQDVDIPALKVVIESVGLQVTSRDFDTSVGAYIGGIYIQHLLLRESDELIAWHSDNGRRSAALTNGPLINLINTPIMDGAVHKLLKVDVLMANKKHPEFKTTYQNTMQNISVNFSVLEVLLHQEALLSTITILQSIQKALEKDSPPAPDKPPSRRLSRRSSMASTLSLAAKMNDRPRRYRGIGQRSEEVINTAVNAYLNNLSVAVCNQEKVLTDFKISGLRASVAVRKSMTTVGASLADVIIMDHLPNAIYPKILSFEQGNVFKMNVVVHNHATEGKHYLDMRSVDVEVTLETSCMKVIFLNRYVQDLLKFVDQFEQARDRLSAAGSAVASSAAAAAQNVKSTASRVKLNVRLKAPVIIVPENSRSSNAVVVDLGLLTATNTFHIAGAGQKDSQGKPPILDKMAVNLTYVKITRALTLGTEVKAECQLLQPINMDVKLTRNLASSWYHGQPDVELDGQLPNLSVMLSQGDFRTTMSVLNDNLQEGEPAPKREPSATTTTPTTPTTTIQLPTIAEVPVDVHLQPDGSPAKSSSDAKEATEKYITVKVNVSVGSVSLKLFNGDSDLSVGVWKHDVDQSLAWFQIKTIDVKADMYSDSSMKAFVNVHSCELDDSRPSRETGITKMIKQCGQSAVTDAANMIDIVLNQDTFTNKDIDLKVNGLNIVICAEYLKQIADFFINGMPKSTPPATSSSSTTAPTPSVEVSPPVVATAETRMQIAVIKPEIILVENSTNMDTNAIILKMHIDALIRSSTAHQIIKASTKDLSIVACSYRTEKRESTKFELLAPVDIEMQSNAPGGKQQHVEVIFVKDVKVNISSSLISTVSAILSSLGTQQTESDDDELKKIPKELWAKKQLVNCDYWFLKDNSEGAESGIKQLNRALSTVSTVPERDEQLLLKNCRLFVTLLGGVGKRTVPFIITDMSVRNVNVMNWSTKMTMSSEITLEVVYYNERLSTWEPLIEPVETDTKHRPWELFVAVKQSDDLDWDVVDNKTKTLPQMEVTILSTDVLEITVTKTALEVFNNLAESFQAAYKLAYVATPEEATAPYIVKNETGMHVSIQPGKFFVTPENASDGQIGLEPDQSLQLHSKEVVGSLMLSNLRSSGFERQGNQSAVIGFVFEDLKTHCEITVNRAEKRVFSMEHRACPGEMWQIVVQIDVSSGCKIITVRSLVQVHNMLPYVVELYYKLSDDAMGRCGSVSPGTTVSLPCDAVYSVSPEVFFKPGIGSFCESFESCKWKDIQPNELQEIVCPASKTDSAPMCFETKVTVENVLHIAHHDTPVVASASSYLITLSPSVVLKNFMPFPISYKQLESEALTSVGIGETVALLNACPGRSTLTLSMAYESQNWTGSVGINTEHGTLSVITFKADGIDGKKSMDLGIHWDRQDCGSLQMSLYCPYWMINKTGLTLRYKCSDDYIVEHGPNGQDMVFFLYKVAQHSSSRKAQVQIDQSDWSDKFSLDTVGNVGKVECKVRRTEPIYASEKGKLVPSSHVSVVGVKIQLASNGLTKIVTFSPFFVLVNKAQFPVECKEPLPGVGWLEVPAGNCVPFWPTSTEKRKMMVVRIKGESNESRPFIITEAHTTLLQIQHEYGGVNVECMTLEGSINIIFQHYYPGCATALIVNHTSHSRISYHQTGVKEHVDELSPGEAAMYTWHDPAGKRELVWRCGEFSQTNELVKEGYGDIKMSSNHAIFWLSFLDGMQRVLLFTEDLATFTRALQAGEVENVEREVKVCLQGIGLSLVNNLQGREIAYMSISSSGIMWEQKKKRRFKPVKPKYGLMLEEGYQHYLSELITKERDAQIPSRRTLNKKLDVDFQSMRMFKPNKVVLQRKFHEGIWICYRTSQHQSQLHVKIHHFQFDNQVSDALFPVVIAWVPPAKSVAASKSDLKPFAELSVMIRKSDFSDVLQFKYCKLLVQEFAVKIDYGFINAMLSFFSSGKANDDYQMTAFMQDCNLAGKSLLDDMALAQSAGVRNYYDLLHCSPIKIHLSLSLSSGSSDSSTDAPQIQSQFLKLFLQSIGVVLTDVQDVIFKLAYFEREHTFYSQSQLTSEVVHHYSQQALKQLYVLVLGLDVLGNPFGVIRGLAEGFSDLFYEPYQGAIQGPEEFAEGLANGVKSLFGHAVGGAAGAVGRITGALGKGIATLTMDEDYKRKRQEAINKRPANVGEGFARGGQSLVTGVVAGITGIVTKPVEGARQEGVKGFFKGAGKGLIGVVVRPVGGVADFASSSFEGIRRIAENSQEIRPVRPARFFQPDGIVRSYVRRDAEGRQILHDASKGKFSSELYIGHLLTSAACRSVLMVTDKRIIFIERANVFGQWNCSWDYSWDQLLEPPQLTTRGVQILLKERQKRLLLRESTIGKMVSIQMKDSKYAEECSEGQAIE